MGSFTPRYSQPFTMAEAIALDVSVITEEIARLQLSLQKLRETQDHLREFTASEGMDPDISQALEENNTVIYSQDERVVMLKAALKEKGVLFDAHYDLSEPAPRNGTQHMPKESSSSADQNDENGLHL